MKLFYYTTNIGSIAIAEDNGYITNLYFKTMAIEQIAEICETDIIKKAAHQLELYLNGKLKEFSLPLAPAGTPFQQRVWQALREIPYGKTKSYKDIALAIENPKAFQAVGQANAKNPIPLIIPCHRVISSNGKLGGYSLGLELKQKLLNLEAKHS